MDGVRTSERLSPFRWSQTKEVHVKSYAKDAYGVEDVDVEVAAGLCTVELLPLPL